MRVEGCGVRGSFGGVGAWGEVIGYRVTAAKPANSTDEEAR